MFTTSPPIPKSPEEHKKSNKYLAEHPVNPPSQQTNANSLYQLHQVQRANRNMDQTVVASQENNQASSSHTALPSETNEFSLKSSLTEEEEKTNYSGSVRRMREEQINVETPNPVLNQDNNIIN